ncbi:MAG: TauD/TfdA family dioxygenase [Acidimicrobiia bacterium]|nr:TauD/TfdA family dioxygenase [Acidimicrobiia bacterium]
MSSDSGQPSATLNEAVGGRTQPPVVMVSIDGVAPRFISPERMPNLTALARAGGGCFTAQTVDPPLTRPVHASMLRGVEPRSHRLFDNGLAPIAGSPPSFLAAARQAGLVTASFNNWLQIETLLEPQASTFRCFIDAGYDPAEDELMVDLLAQVVRRSTPDVSFVYFCRPDLAGHDFGWGSDPYLESLYLVDQTFGRLVELVDGADLVVTTDHGGLGTRHHEAVDEIMTTFVAVRSARIEPGSFWSEASVLDIAPTVADLAGFAPDGNWQGRSLIGHQQSLLDRLLGLLQESSNRRYGEDLSMLAHALQTATAMEASDADDDLIVAALLHDIGHLLGRAGAHGYPDHAEAAAAFLGPWLPAPITVPIRLHVAAKRHLVGSDPAYLDQLSPASKITLQQQGGPFADDGSAAFLNEPHAERAIALRTSDDRGKDPNLPFRPLDDYRPRLARALTNGPVDAAWARDACRCPDCRDSTSDQHLLDVTDLAGWTVLGTRRTGGELLVDLTGANEHHVARIPSSPLADDRGSNREPMPRSSKFDPAARPREAADIEAIAFDVVEVGVAYVRGLGSREGTVLEFARSLGFVRETNYGRLFDVRTEPRAINLAYTPVALPLHTDNPYRDPVPTVQILHCLRPAAEGGATLLADGLAAAEALRRADIRAFTLLSTTDVLFRFHDSTVDFRARRRIIDCRPDGTVEAVYLNHRSLDTPTNEPFRRALQAFVDTLAGFTIELTLAAGDAIVFDNRRVLHARTGFDPSSGRHLQGCYIDIDTLRSTASTVARQS